MKRRGDTLSLTENTIIIITVVLLFLFMAKRMENSTYLVNRARAQKELSRIYNGELDYYRSYNAFGDKIDLSFKPKFPYSGIEYVIDIDSTNFWAVAREASGNDAFGDGRPGNEYIAIDASGKFIENTFLR